MKERRRMRRRTSKDTDKRREMRAGNATTLEGSRKSNNKNIGKSTKKIP
jgi:hypothetical protein